MQQLEFILAKISERNWKLHPYWKEWGAAILVAATLWLTTMAFSLFAGFNFMYDKVFQMIGFKVVSIVLSVFVLVSIEALTGFFLSKLFKFALRKMLLRSTVVFFGVLAFWSLSFHMSTNGLSMRQSAKADNSEHIRKQFDIDATAIKRETKAEIDFIKEQISQVEAATWKGRLSSTNLEKIKQYNDQIFNLKNQERIQLNELTYNRKAAEKLNQTARTSEADKYYNIMAVNMAAQFALVFFLMLSYSQISKERNPEQHQNEKVQAVTFQIQDILGGVFHTELKRFENGLKKAQQVIALNEYNATELEPEPLHNTAPETRRPGFAIPTISTQLHTENEPTQNANIGAQNNGTNAVNVPLTQRNANANATQLETTTERLVTENAKGFCVNCGKPLPDNSTRRRRYCNDNCKNEFHSKKSRKGGI